MLVRLAAATRILGGHHSAQRPPRAAATAMPTAAPRGGHSADAPADITALLARIDVLERRMQGGKSKGAKGEGRRDHYKGGMAENAAVRTGTARSGGFSRGKPGDWQCQACQAYPCFARTTACYVCGAARGGKGAGAGGGGAKGLASFSRQRRPDEYLGPIGAGGTRPLLGRRAADAAGLAAAAQRGHADSPTARAPGASLAARSEVAGAGKGGQSSGGVSSMCIDEEGYQVVRNGVPKRVAEQAAEEITAGGRRMPKRAHGAWAELSEQPEEDDDPDPRQQGDDELDGDAHANDDNETTVPTGGHGDAGARQTEEKENGDEGGEVQEQQLRKEWQNYCQVCRNLERDVTTPARLLADARSLRDEAERKWRAAKTPHPLYKRVRWAEAELRDAQAKEALHQRELDAHLEQTARRTRELETRQRADASRTARKLVALQELHREGATSTGLPAAERAARIAATGMGMDVVPALAAAVERLSMPLGDDVEAFRDELRQVAISASRVEGVLKEAVCQTATGGGPARFDIGDAAHGGGGSDGAATADGDGNGGRDATGATGTPTTNAQAAAAAKWRRTQENGPWRRSSSSEAAAQQARRLLAQEAARRTGDAREAASGVPPSTTGDDTAATDTAIDEHQQEASGATTNDLAEAERRDRRRAEAQFQQAVLQSHSMQQRQNEELQRQQRAQQQQEELRRHQEQLQRANEARAAEEAKQREALIASMSQDELARAAALHAQQAAVGSRAFGTQAASELAGIAHQHHVLSVASAASPADEGAAVDALMAMSPEDFAAWERDRHGVVADGAGW